MLVSVFTGRNSICLMMTTVVRRGCNQIFVSGFRSTSYPSLKRRGGTSRAATTSSPPVEGPSLMVPVSSLELELGAP